MVGQADRRIHGAFLSYEDYYMIPREGNHQQRLERKDPGILSCISPFIPINVQDSSLL